MLYLQRQNQPPAPLPEAEQRQLEKRFDADVYRMSFEPGGVELGLIDEVEVAQAARLNNPAGWLLRKLIFSGERYHVGVYFGQHEIVLTIISRAMAEYVVRTIAYLAQQPIRYTGIEGIAPVVGS